VTESQIRSTLCQLNDAFENQEIMNQCLAGIKNYCSDKANFGTCKSIYDETFKQSVYVGMEICAPWNSGWKSTNCGLAADQVKGKFTTAENKYKQYFVEFIRSDLFSNRDYAPCYTSETQKTCLY
jgi:hypothetical protein